MKEKYFLKQKVGGQIQIVEKDKPAPTGVPPTEKRRDGKNQKQSLNASMVGS